MHARLHILNYKNSSHISCGKSLATEKQTNQAQSETMTGTSSLISDVFHPIYQKDHSIIYHKRQNIMKYNSWIRYRVQPAKQQMDMFTIHILSYHIAHSMLRANRCLNVWISMLRHSILHNVILQCLLAFPRANIPIRPCDSCFKTDYEK